MSRAALLFAIAGPPTAWAIHFVVIYAGLSAACAARDLIDPLTFWIVAAVATVLALAACAVSLVRRGPDDGDMAQATFWIALISAGAIVYNVLPVPFYTSCGG